MDAENVTSSAFQLVCTRKGIQHLKLTQPLELYTKTACQKSRGQPTNPGVPGKMASKMMCDVKKIVMSYTGVTWISMYL